MASGDRDDNIIISGVLLFVNRFNALSEASGEC